MLRISSLAVATTAAAAIVWSSLCVSSFVVPSGHRPSWSLIVTRNRNSMSIGPLWSGTDDENESLSFSDAEQAIREEEEERRLQQRGDDTEEVRNNIIYIDIYIDMYIYEFIQS